MPQIDSNGFARAHGFETAQTSRKVVVKELFANADQTSSLSALCYRREVYRHISNMSDRADAAAHVLGMVVMKLA